MNLPAITQATLLLTAYFDKAKNTPIRPLTNKEWGKLAFWLKDHHLKPEDLFEKETLQLISTWDDSKITFDRVQALLNRGASMALALEKWSRAGIWVISRSEPNYPSRLKKHLQIDSPPILFGCGNINLLNSGGIAVIGSRKTSDADLEFSRGLGELASQSGLNIVSGGARGVDETAMLGALESNGTVIGILADSLFRACNSHKYRSYLINEKLVLVSPFYPESGFNAGNAMQRNKYIYCLSDAAVAVHSGTSGGTWNGALENIKKQWVPMWVKETSDPHAGNSLIVSKGAHWLSSDLSSISLPDLFADSLIQPKPQTSDLFQSSSTLVSVEKQAVKEHKERESQSSKPPLSPQPPQLKSATPSNTKNASTEISEGALQGSFYRLFLQKLQVDCERESLTIEEISERLSLNKSQVKDWIKRASEEGKVKKLTRPVRYQWRAYNPQGTLI